MSVPESITIRDGVLPDDVEPCAELWVNALANRDGDVEADAVRQRVRSAFANPIIRFAVATSPRMGFSLVEGGRAEPTDALLRFLAVEPDGRGSGVGAALLADAIDHATSGGFSTLTLEVRPSNDRAIKLYTRAGFEKFGPLTPHPLNGSPMQPYRLALT